MPGRGSTLQVAWARVGVLRGCAPGVGRVRGIGGWGAGGGQVRGGRFGAAGDVHLGYDYLLGQGR